MPGASGSTSRPRVTTRPRPGVAGDAAAGEGGEHLREGAGVEAVGLMAGLGLEGEHAVGGVQDEVDLASAVRAEEVGRWRLTSSRMTSCWP